MSNSTTNNKAGIKRVPIDLYRITPDDVVNYLQNQLGFSVVADFTKWQGISPNHAYVRMRVLLSPNNIAVKSNTSSYIDKVLQENSLGIELSKDVLEILKPFMYPENFSTIYSKQDDLNRLCQQGLFGDRLADVIKNSKLAYSKNHDLFTVYLMPEKIIADMLVDPSTNKIGGNMSITNVVSPENNNTEVLRWDVYVSKENDFGSTNPGIIDAVFSNRS